MSAPESEWMLWAKRLRTSIRAEHDAEFRALPSHFPILMHNGDQFQSIKEQVQDLAAGNEHTHQANQALQNRIEQLESDAACREQKSMAESESLQHTTENFARQLEHIYEAFEQLKKESQLVTERQQQELEGIGQQIHELKRQRAISPQNKATPEAVSEATTTDITVNDVAQPPQESHQSQRDDPVISQGRATYEQYLASGDTFVQAMIAQSEVQAVKIFVQGMRQAFRRKRVWKALEEKGWTWENARCELQRIVDQGKRPRRTPRTAELPSLEATE
ncbi:MAG: hypothetical protein Q9219_000265 [cf. Caloplaca sp. 3 TL-2023]